MKKLFLLISILISFSAFSGDLNLVCEDQYGDLLATETIDFDQSSTMVEYHDMVSDKYTVNVAYLHKDKAITYIIFEMNSGLPIEQDYKKVKYFQEVKLPFGHACMVRD